MSEFGAGITAKRNDDQTIDETEAQKLVKVMNDYAVDHDMCGAFDQDGPECGLGWSNKDGSYTLVATSSPLYKMCPPEVYEDSMEHDLAFAGTLASAIERAFPGAYVLTVESQEW